jgi:hypothetical protein
MPTENRLEMEDGRWWIQLTTATVEFFFAPAERDVYSSSALKDLAPLGAKRGLGSGMP